MRRPPPRRSPLPQLAGSPTGEQPQASRLKEFVSCEVVPVGGLTLKFVTLFLFLRFSLLHEYIAIKLHANLYILVVVGGIAYTALLRGEVWRRVKNAKVFRAWLFFSALLAIGVPFGLWPGGSYAIVMPFVKDNVLCIPLIGALFGSWTLLRRILLVIASAGVVVVGLSCLYPTDVGGRMGVGWNGSVANPNDVAGHLLFLIPFLFIAGFSSYVKGVLRPLYLLSIPFAMFLLLKTGSRGAFIGLAALVLFLFLTGNARIRIGFVLCAPIVFCGLFAFLPKSSFDRLFTFTSGSPNHEEAIESYEARQNLLRMSIAATLEHPILGVGAGQFGSYEGNKAIEEGHPHNNWQEAHNSFTQVSSETGIPALLCMLYATFGSIRIFWRTRKLASKNSRAQEIASAAQFLFVGAAAFCVCIFFLNFGYKMYLPFLTGLAIALERTTANLQTEDPSREPTDVDNRTVLLRQVRWRQENAVRA